MGQKESREDKPVEVFCPICGYTSYVKHVDEQFDTLPREEKVKYVKALQLSEHPVFTCGKCDIPEQTARIMEVR